MGTTMTMSGLLAIRSAEVQAAGDKHLYEETQKFLRTLFRDPLVRPATLRMRRAERPAIERFVDDQRKVLLEVASLLRDFLDLYPHEQDCERYRCGAPECDLHLATLQELLKGVVSDLDSRGSTPARKAVECLRASFTSHVCATRSGDHDTTARTMRIDERLAELWLRHTTRCWQRADWLRVSPGHSLDLLLGWTTGALTLTASEAREHLSRVSRELLVLAEGLERMDAAFDRFRRLCEERDLPVLRAIARRSGPAPVALFVTARAEECLSTAGLPAWSFAGGRRPSPTLSSLAVEATAYGEDEPASAIYDGICRFHGRLASARESVDEAVLLVLRVGGPGCELPKRLELERFAISLVSIDLQEGGAIDAKRVRMGVEPILEAICRADLNEVPPTHRTARVPSPAEATPPSTPRPPSSGRLGTSLGRISRLSCPGKS